MELFTGSNLKGIFKIEIISVNILKHDFVLLTYNDRIIKNKLL